MTPLVPERKISFGSLGLILLAVIFVTLLLALAGWWVADRWIQKLPAKELIPRLYKKIYRYANWAGLSVGSGDTPYQFSDSLIQYITTLGKGSYWSDWILEGPGMVRSMTTVFVRCLFDPQSLDLNSAEIFSLFKQLRHRLWLLWLLGRAYNLRFLRPFLWIESPLFIQNLAEEES